jgi:hypothetical protein
MKKTLNFVAAVALLVGSFSAPLEAQPVSEDSGVYLTPEMFIKSSPAQIRPEAEKENARSVRAPETVSHGELSIGGFNVTPLTWAKDARDAVNAIRDSRRQSGLSFIGTYAIAFPEGVGAVATGTAVFDTFPNPDASKVSKRIAYSAAYLDAKTQLTNWSKGAAYEFQEKGNGSIVSSIDSAESLSNANERFEEFLRLGVSGIVRRHSVYDVFEDTEGSRVYVTLVSSPALWDGTTRPASAALSAETLREGLAQVFAEINNSLMLPVGGKAVYVPATGEMAYVGYGIEIVVTNENKAMQARLTLAAERVARMRADISLSNILLSRGTLSGNLEFKSNLKRAIEDLVAQSKDDLTESVDELEYAKIKGQIDLFHNSRVFTDAESYADKGETPPGVSRESWADRDKGFACAVSVYVPSLASRVENVETLSGQRK